MISKSGPVAPWRQLYALIRRQIEDGTLSPGDRVPSIATLAQEHDLNHTTIQKALRQLKDDGLVVTSPMGTYVAEP